MMSRSSSFDIQQPCKLMKFKNIMNQYIYIKIINIIKTLKNRTITLSLFYPLVIFTFRK